MSALRVAIGGAAMKLASYRCLIAVAICAALCGCPAPSIIYPPKRTSAHAIGVENWIAIPNADASWAITFQQIRILTSSQFIGIARVIGPQVDTNALVQTADGGRTWKYAALSPSSSDILTVQSDLQISNAFPPETLLLVGFQSKVLLKSGDGITWLLVPTPISSVSGAISRTWITGTGSVFLGWVETLDCCSPPRSGQPQSPAWTVFALARSDTQGNSWQHLEVPSPCRDATLLGPPRIGNGTDDSVALLCRAYPGEHLYRIDFAANASTELAPIPYANMDFSVSNPFVLPNKDVLVEYRVPFTPTGGLPSYQYQLALYPVNDIGNPRIVFDQSTTSQAAGIKNLTISANGLSYLTFNHDVFVSTDSGRQWALAFRVEDTISKSIDVVSPATAILVRDDGDVVITNDSGANWCDIAPGSTDRCRNAVPSVMPTSR